ncbi:MAG TPA: alpha/beta hydrolase, partial [Pseudomonas sp.]|nr:alpha/beta hydrolase [Pseudomonas sp.]
MRSSWFALLRRRRLSLIVMACLLVLIPVGCAKLEQTERELVFRIEPGTARWFSGLPTGIEDVQLQSPDLGADESLHAWWWPAARKDAPALLYLHGSRWN